MSHFGHSHEFAAPRTSGCVYCAKQSARETDVVDSRVWRHGETEGGSEFTATATRSHWTPESANTAGKPRSRLTCDEEHAACAKTTCIQACQECHDKQRVPNENHATAASASHSMGAPSGSLSSGGSLLVHRSMTARTVLVTIGASESGNGQPWTAPTKPQPRNNVHTVITLPADCELQTMNHCKLDTPAGHTDNAHKLTQRGPTEATQVECTSQLGRPQKQTLALKSKPSKDTLTGEFGSPNTEGAIGTGRRKWLHSWCHINATRLA